MNRYSHLFIAKHAIIANLCLYHQEVTGLALALLVAAVRADDPDGTPAFDDLAVSADLLD
jgi:hypothetical protein